MRAYLPVGPVGEIPVDAAGAPLYFSTPPFPDSSVTVAVTPELTAVAVELGRVTKVVSASTGSLPAEP